MSNAAQFTILPLPRDHSSLLHLLPQLRNFRLASLLASPGSFSSTHEVEAAFSEQDWLSRYSKSDRVILVAFATSSSTSNALDANTDWLGQIVLVGPMKDEEYFLPHLSSFQPSATRKDKNYQLSSLYVLPSARGKGLARLLIEGAAEVAKKDSAGEALLRTMVKPTNEAAKKLFGAVGFEQSGLCTLREAWKANGETGQGGEEVDLRSGWVAERLVGLLLS
ncbi:hypothetical protein BT69DRAFT_1222234 [Atractiella rhizophila]|nr:hypothetical protein BT69DRAFT_1222234 [Atractiella rhizophila]